MGGCGNGRDATTPFICAPVHPHSPFAIRRGRRMSHTPALHVRDTHCLIDTTQWYTPSSGAGIDIWAAETKGNGAHFSASTYSSVVSGQVRKVTFPAVIKGIGLHNNQGGSYKRQQTSSQLSFCCTTGLGCHINIYSNCLLCCSNLWHTGFQQLLLFLYPPLLSLISFCPFMSYNLMGIKLGGGGGRKLDMTPLTTWGMSSSCCCRGWCLQALLCVCIHNTRLQVK